MVKTSTLLLFLFLGFQIATAQIPVLWGMTTRGGAAPVNGSIFSVNGDGSNFLDVADFDGPNGFKPFGNLAKTNTGKLYGMTTYGGNNQNGESAGYGVIFSFDSTNNNCTSVYNFDSTNGNNPFGNLLMASDTIYYGMTSAGGANNLGVIFSFDTTTDTYTKLYDFNDTLGSSPKGSLIQATNGTLYGLTKTGGKYGYGVIFSYAITEGIYTDLHDFDSSDGAYPKGSLIQAYDGNLYGLTSSGGANGNGVIFSIDTLGITYNKLFDFTQATGETPYGSLTQTQDSLFYGLTFHGGANDSGVVFNFNATTLTYTDLYDMNGANGSSPYGSLLLASDNNLYGTTCYGGANAFGTVFSFDPSNNYYLKLVDFDFFNGAYPHGDLVQLSQTVATGVGQSTVNSNQLSVYPNPSNGLINITSSKNIDKVVVTNLLGQTVLKSPPAGGDLGVTQFSFELTNTGMYFVTVKEGTVSTTSKVVVNP